jgi:hypothetical protein
MIRYRLTVAVEIQGARFSHINNAIGFSFKIAAMVLTILCMQLRTLSYLVYDLCIRSTFEIAIQERLSLVERDGAIQT